MSREQLWLKFFFFLKSKLVLWVSIFKARITIGLVINISNLFLCKKYDFNKTMALYEVIMMSAAILNIAMAGLDWDHLFLETEDRFPKKYCFESNEKKSLEEIKEEIFKRKCILLA